MKRDDARDIIERHIKKTFDASAPSSDSGMRAILWAGICGNLETRLVEAIGMLPDKKAKQILKDL